jgi:hypothetical protein
MGSKLVNCDQVRRLQTGVGIRDEVDALGGEIIGGEYVLPNGTEVTGIVCTIAQREPDVIFNSLVGDE